MQQFSDERLMQDYAGGDVNAFEALYHRYRGPLYRHFTRQVADRSTANDLYQGCWEKVIKARMRYRASAPFKAWLFRIAHHHLVDHYRASRKAEPLDAEATAASNPGPDGVAEAGIRQLRFRAALVALPPEQRDVVLLHFEGGLSLAEIGTLSGVDRETVKSRMRYARQKLKQALST